MGTRGVQKDSMMNLGTMAAGTKARQKNYPFGSAKRCLMLPFLLNMGDSPNKIHSELKHICFLTHLASKALW